MGEAVTHRPAITAAQFGEALRAAGILEETGTVHRVVIDAKAGNLVVMYIERYADERWLDVALTLDGVEVRTSPQEA